MIDLHAHTNASDGQYPPEELVRRAAEAGLTALAVTDHDTLAGIPRAEAEAQKAGLELVPGIELSAFVNGREAHILGHFVDPSEPRLRDIGQQLRQHRERRMGQMIEKLAQFGLKVRFEDVVAASGGETLARPHLARVMVERGYVRDVKEAFDRYIATGKPAWVDRYRLGTREAIELIGAAGGTATLAHPHVSGLSDQEIANLAKEGLSGLEAAHSEHAPAIRDRLRLLARDLDLVATAGSDFHGEAVVPGRRLGMAATDPEEFERLRERARARREAARERSG